MVRQRVRAGDHHNVTNQASPGPGTEVAPIYMGGYTRRGGRSPRRQLFDAAGPHSAKDATIIFAFRTDISWDAQLAKSVCFRSATAPMRLIHIVAACTCQPSSQFIHLVSLTKGAMRMVLLSSDRPDKSNARA